MQIILFSMAKNDVRIKSQWLETNTENKNNGIKPWI